MIHYNIALNNQTEKQEVASWSRFQLPIHTTAIKPDRALINAIASTFCLSCLYSCRSGPAAASLPPL